MRRFRELLTTLAAVAGVAAGGPALAAIAVKPDVDVGRLAHCAVALNRWTSISKAQGLTPQPEVVARLNAIKATAVFQDKSTDTPLTRAMIAQIGFYDELQTEDGDKMMETLRADVLACNAIFDIGPAEAEVAPTGPVLVGGDRKMVLDTSPSYAGYCFLAYRTLGEESGSLSQAEREEKAGFVALVDGNTTAYRRAALESANNRADYYGSFRSSHSSQEFDALIRADIADCAKYIVSR